MTLARFEKNSLNLCLPIYPMLSLSLPCQATTLWGHKMGLREWGGNCGWRAMEYDKKEETWWTGRSREEGDSRELWLLRLVSFLCRHYAHLRRPWEGKNKKVDFAIFSSIPSLQSRLRRIHNWQAITTLADYMFGLIPLHFIIKDPNPLINPVHFLTSGI